MSSIVTKETKQLLHDLEEHVMDPLLASLVTEDDPKLSSGKPVIPATVMMHYYDQIYSIARREEVVDYGQRTPLVQWSLDQCKAYLAEWTSSIPTSELEWLNQVVYVWNCYGRLCKSLSFYFKPLDVLMKDINHDMLKDTITDKDMLSWHTVVQCLFYTDYLCHFDQKLVSCLVHICSGLAIQTVEDQKQTSKDEKQMSNKKQMDVCKQVFQMLLMLGKLYQFNHLEKMQMFLNRGNFHATIMSLSHLFTLDHQSYLKNVARYYQELLLHKHLSGGVIGPFGPPGVDYNPIRYVQDELRQSLRGTETKIDVPETKVSEFEGGYDLRCDTCTLVDLGHHRICTVCGMSLEISFQKQIEQRIKEREWKKAKELQNQKEKEEVWLAKQYMKPSQSSGIRSIPSVRSTPPITSALSIASDKPVLQTMTTSITDKTSRWMCVTCCFSNDPMFVTHCNMCDAKRN